MIEQVEGVNIPPSIRFKDFTRRALLLLLGARKLEEISVLRLTVRLLLLSSIVMLISIVVTSMGPHHEPGRIFREGHLMTWVSVLLLFGVGFFSNEVWKVVSKGAPFDLNKEIAIWRIMAVAFAYFAADELLRIHETVDRYMHKMIGMDPNGPTDCVDDLIVGLYGLFALHFMFRYRRELFRYLRSIPYLVAACALAAAHIVADLVSGSRELSAMAMPFVSDVNFSMTWIGVLEEIIKIYAEIVFLGAFACCYTLSVARAKNQIVK